MVKNESTKNGKYMWARRDGKNVMAHRLVMEAKLGRRLTSDEIVHHINDAKDDNQPDNLELLDRSTHSYLHSLNKPAQVITFNCAYCGKEVLRKTAQLKSDLSNSYCGKVCAGKDKYNRGIRPPINTACDRYEEMDKIIIDEIENGLGSYRIANKYNWNRKTVYTHIKSLVSKGIIKSKRRK